MRGRLTLLAVIAVTILGVSACATSADGMRVVARNAPAGAGQAGGGGQDSAASAQKPVTVPQSLAFSARTLDGKPFDAASLAGKPVVLWFCAPWCPTCVGEAGSVADLAPKYTGKVAFVGVAGMGGEPEMRQFVTEGEVGGIPHLSDNAGTIWRRFGITEQSVYVLIDRAGNVVLKGFLDDLRLTDEVARLAG